jgi:hypothetical protein
MDRGRLIPLIQSAEDIVGYFLKSSPIQIILLRKILLIAMLATKIAEIRDVPLNMELILQEITRGDVSTIKIILRLN